MILLSTCLHTLVPVIRCQAKNTVLDLKACNKRCGGPSEAFSDALQSAKSYMRSTWDFSYMLVGFARFFACPPRRSETSKPLQGRRISYGDIDKLSMNGGSAKGQVEVTT